MSRARQLRQRQSESGSRVRAKVTETRDAPRLTIERLRELIATAKENGEETIEVIQRRAKKPSRWLPILLVFYDGDKRRVGPPSISEHPVEHAGGHNYRARWRVRDCELVLVGRPAS